MPDPLRNPIRIRLGAQLRAVRRLAGLSGQALAGQLGVSQSKVSRIETGDLWPPLAEITTWLDICGADQPTRERVMSMARDIELGVTMLRDVVDGGAEVRADELASLDDTAVSVRHFQPSLVPGMLQTEGYARLIVEAASVHGGRDIAAAVAARMERAARLRDERGRRYHVVVTEAGLRWRPAGPVDPRPGVWRHILDVAPAITFRVIADGAPSRAVPTCGYTLHDLADGGTVAIVETPAAELTFGGADETAAFEAMWSRAVEAALSPAESVDLVAGLLR